MGCAYLLMDNSVLTKENDFAWSGKEQRTRARLGHGWTMKERQEEEGKAVGVWRGGG